MATKKKTQDQAAPKTEGMHISSLAWGKDRALNSGASTLSQLDGYTPEETEHGYNLVSPDGKHVVFVPRELAVVEFRSEAPRRRLGPVSMEEAKIRKEEKRKAELARGEKIRAQRAKEAAERKKKVEAHDRRVAAQREADRQAKARAARGQSPE